MSRDPVAAIDEWRKLRAGSYSASESEIPTRPSHVSVAVGPIRFALGVNGEPRILLPLDERERLPKLEQTPSLKFADVAYRMDGRSRRFLDITCLSASLENVFAEVADEILTRVLQGGSCPSATQQTLIDFRTLLLMQNASDIEETAVAGLIGELLVLNRLLERSSDAWRTWRGPDGDRHDFRSGQDSIEVKTTNRPANTVVTISAIDQLQVPTGGSLHLDHVVLEPVAGGVLSVAALAASVLAKANRPAEIVDRLSRLGCPAPDAPEWNRTTYRLEREQVFEVRPGFPRIEAADFKDEQVPAGIVDIEYQIDLNLASTFRISSDAAEALEERMIACLSKS